MTIRRWLLVAAALCGVVGVSTLTLAVCCVVNLVGGQCELWFLGPFVTLPLGMGLWLIGRVSGQPAMDEELSDDGGAQ